MNHPEDRQALERRLWVLVPLASFLWFWFWRSNQWTGGDSEQWEREIYNGVWFRKRQMFSFAFMQSVYTIGDFLWGWSSRLAVNLASCLSGAAAMLIVWRMHCRRPLVLWPFLVVATAGFTTLFHGHIETYAHSVVALLLHLLAVQRTAEGRWEPWTVVTTFGLVMVFHLVVLFTLPAMALVALSETRRRRSGPRAYMELLKAVVPFVLFWVAITRMNWGIGEMVGYPVSPFIHPPLEMLRRPWLVFMHETFPVKCWFLVWNAGFCAPLALWIFGRALGRTPRDRLTLYLLAYFICFLGFTAVWNPGALHRDFDLFCFPWVVACVAVSHRVTELPARAVWIGLALGVNAYLWVSRTAGFADVGRRGHGTIVLERALSSEEADVVIDNRLQMRPTNRFIPQGAHTIRVYLAKRRKFVNRAIVMEPGDTYRLIVNTDGIQINKQENLETNKEKN